MTRHHTLGYWLAWPVVLLIIPAIPILAANANLVANVRDMAGIDLGIAAYAWWTEAIFLSARPAWMERAVGLPALYAIHGTLGVLALAASGMHILMLDTFHPIIRWTGLVAWYLAAVCLLLAILFHSGILADRITVFRRLAARTARIIPHEALIWIHRLNLVAVILVWAHIHVIPRFASSSNRVFLLIVDAMAVIAFAALAWARLVAPTDPRRGGVIVDTRDIDARARRLDITLTRDALTPRAGDYYMLSIPDVPGLSREPHPFSVASVSNPIDSSTGATVSFLIRNAGDFTGQLALAAPGSAVTLEGPFGQLADEIDAIPHAPLVCIAMGAGVAPIAALCEHYAASRSLTVLYSSHASDHDEDFGVLDRLSRPGSGSNGHAYAVYRSGSRFTRPMLEAVLTRADVAHALFVVVGPSHAVLSIEHALRRIGVTPSRILDERMRM